MAKQIKIGQKFGKLKVVSEAFIFKKFKHVTCYCECGKNIDVRIYSLLDGNTKSCGCLNQNKCNHLTPDLIGKKWGRLTVVEKLDYNEKRCCVWKCKCNCGNYVNLVTAEITRESSKSCGCLTKEVNRERFLGKHNPRYNPNLSDTDRQNRDNDLQEAQWSWSVKVKYNFTCQKCKEKGKRLNSHHIKNYASNKELRYNMDNGICLCEKCHKTFHKNMDCRIITNGK